MYIFEELDITQNVVNLENEHRNYWVKLKCLSLCFMRVILLGWGWV